MKKIILFIQGGGEKGYEADAQLAASLKENLKDEYSVHYPEMNQMKLHPVMDGFSKSEKKFHILMMMLLWQAILLGLQCC
ncbi:MAG: hypothetical protein WAM24_14975 [Ignavibacteriaceae bacterium]